MFAPSVFFMHGPERRFGIGRKRFGRHASPSAPICEAAASYRPGGLTPPCFVSLWAGAQNAGIFARRIRFFCPASVLAHGKKRVSLPCAVPPATGTGFCKMRPRRTVWIDACAQTFPAGLSEKPEDATDAHVRMPARPFFPIRRRRLPVPPPSFTPSGRRFAISAVRPFSCAFAVSSPKNDTSAPRNFFAIMIQYP